MPLIKLNRINKGGEIHVNSERMLFVEVEGRSTTVHLGQNLLFSVEELPETIAAQIEVIESARIKTALVEAGLGKVTG